MRRTFVSVFLIIGLIGTSASPALANPASASCQKLKKQVLVDHPKLLKLYKAYSPAAFKKGSSFSQKEFNFYWAKLTEYNRFAIKMYTNMNKYPECFSAKQFEIVSRYYSAQTNFPKFVTKELILKGGFVGFENKNVYG